MRHVVLALVGLLVLTACGGPGTGDKGYVDGNGVITRLAVGQRHTVGDVSGAGLDGSKLSLAALRGKVVVVNVWGSWCAPCRAEAPRLASAAKELGTAVAFVGINTRDASADNARAFERTYAVPYPSIYDPDGRTLMSFAGAITPSAIPSTIIIDAHGRIAASIIGGVTGDRTVVDLVHDVEAES